MKNWPEFKIENLDDYQKIVNTIPTVDDWLSNWLFRGQTNKIWSLEPSINRIIKRHGITDNSIASKIESSITLEFVSKYHLYENHNLRQENPLLWYSIMQHYGCPTRLLDWTYSPYTALYFSVNEGFNNDGAVFFFNEETFSRQKEINLKSTEILTANVEQYLDAVIPAFHSKRSNFQQGCFTVTSILLENHADIISNSLHGLITEVGTPYAKIIIPAKSKIKILTQLKTMNVKGETLFPDLYGLGQFLKDSVEIRSYQAPKNN